MNDIPRSTGPVRHSPSAARRIAAAVCCSTLMLICAAGVSGQYRPNVVFWDDQPACGSKRIKVGDDKQFSCRIETQGRHNARVIETAGLKISILPGRTDRFVTLLTKIRNKASEELSLDPSKWSMAHYETREAFLGGKPPVVYEESVDIRIPVKNGRVVATPPVNPFPTAETRTIDKRGSASSPNIVTRTTPQTVIAPTTGNVGTSNFPTVTVTEARVRTGVEGFKTTQLRADSVSPKEVANGIVYFGRVKESLFQLAFIHIGDTTFVFEVN